LPVTADGRGWVVDDVWVPAVSEPRRGGGESACLPGPIGPCEWAGGKEKAVGETELGRVHAGEMGRPSASREEVFFFFFFLFFFFQKSFEQNR